MPRAGDGAAAEGAFWAAAGICAAAPARAAFLRKSRRLVDIVLASVLHGPRSSISSVEEMTAPQKYSLSANWKFLGPPVLKIGLNPEPLVTPAPRLEFAMFVVVPKVAPFNVAVEVPTAAKEPN